MLTFSKSVSREASALDGDDGTNDADVSFEEGVPQRSEGKQPEDVDGDGLLSDDDIEEF